MYFNVPTRSQRSEFFVQFKQFFSLTLLAGISKLDTVRLQIMYSFINCDTLRNLDDTWELFPTLFPQVSDNSRI